MNYIIIGCGALAQKRIKELKKINLTNLTAIYDTNNKLAEKIKYENKCEIITDLEKFDYTNIKFALISTPHKFLVSYTITLINKGIKNFFIEKPGADSLESIKKLKKYEKKCNFYFGYNHRFFESIIDLKKIFNSKKYGRFLFLRGIYGHGGRKNYESEWRFDKDISGGGQLIDQGIHLIDLCNFFSNEKLSVEYSNLKSLFWKKKIEDNTHLVLKDKNNRNFFLHNSWTEWKNKFHIESFFEYGKVEITGIGKSYGEEKLIIYKMNKSLKPPNIITKRYKYNG